MLDRFRDSKAEYWHRRNTFLMIHTAIESGLPIANALDCNLPLYEPFSSELEIVHNGILEGRTLAEIAENDFEKSSPKWLKYLIKYEKKGRVSKGFLHLSRFSEKSVHKKIFWNLLFPSSNPPSVFAWIINIFVVCMFIPILPWEVKGDKIIVLGIFEGNTTNIYSIADLSLFSLNSSADDSISNQGTDLVDSGNPIRKGDYLYDLVKYVDQGFNFPDKNEFIEEGEILGYSKGELECIWGKEFHRYLVSDQLKLGKLLEESAPSPVPIVWMYRSLIGTVLGLISEPEYDEKAIIKKSCKGSELIKIFNRLGSTNIQKSKGNRISH